MNWPQRLLVSYAGTYDAQTKTGGPNDSIRNEEEYSHDSNNGLKKAIDFCGFGCLCSDRLHPRQASGMARAHIVCLGIWCLDIRKVYPFSGIRMSLQR
ncbi:hypothetical protein K1719_043105 [Acacia pycnantha]|nr:hypothetical protein K1719_043105 [Acacia pycnantha]